MLIAIGAILLLVVGIYISTANVTALKNKVEALGEVKGRGVDEIVSALGPPQAREGEPERELLTWYQGAAYNDGNSSRKHTYFVSILFSSGICQGIHTQGEDVS
jgi:hypothetical protein